jgi:hypothetical protein
MASPTRAFQGRRPFLARTLLATALTAATLVFGASTSSAATEAPTPLPEPACQRIDFNRAYIRTADTGTFERYLVVSGFKPTSNMEVELSPLVYIRQPEYWEIEVLGCQRGLGLPVLTPYTVALRIDGTIGTKGIEVVGATRSPRIDIPARPKELPY